LTVLSPLDSRASLISRHPLNDPRDLLNWNFLLKKSREQELKAGEDWRSLRVLNVDAEVWNLRKWEPRVQVHVREQILQVETVMVQNPKVRN
jgi:hypothetical protein